jgi:hypothetical protein
LKTTVCYWLFFLTFTLTGGANATSLVITNLTSGQSLNFDGDYLQVEQNPFNFAVKAGDTLTFSFSASDKTPPSWSTQSTVNRTYEAYGYESYMGLGGKQGTQIARIYFNNLSWVASYTYYNSSLWSSWSTSSVVPEGGLNKLSVNIDYEFEDNRFFSYVKFSNPYPGQSVANHYVDKTQNIFRWSEQVTLVPEPSASVLGSIGLILGALMRRRRVTKIIKNNGVQL